MATAQTNAFSVLLRQHRRSLRLTQAELAERAGYSMVYISMLERGARTPLPATVARLAQVLDLPPHDRVALQAAARRLPPAGTTDASVTGVPLQSELSLPMGHFLGALP